jgi:A/G-specific adenine glycosylase
MRERSAMRGAVREWYAPRARAYPWRRGPVDAYRTLVAEVMLQQTQAARVVPVYGRFLARFPSVRQLARAPRADVLRAWAGLGYNRRAVSLHRAAQAIVAEHGGRVPVEPEALRRLPGIGPYTAAAVASIPGGLPVAAIDVNARRIVARVAFGREPDELSSASVAEEADRWLDRRDPGSWNQALMDLGREHCRSIPRCDGCPLSTRCRWVRADRVPTRLVGRRTEPFEGSSRHVRGRVVDLLRQRRSADLPTLASISGFPASRVGGAIEGLLRDGIVERTGRSYRLTTV